MITREEYLEELKARNYKVGTDEWNKSLYKCPRCNGEVKRDYSHTYMSDPPKYRYYCRNCTYEEVI